MIADEPWTNSSIASPKNGWGLFEEGKTVGRHGSEGGSIVLDEEHSDGARITLERGGTVPFAITCGIHGWFLHTRFFGSEEIAKQEFMEMKVALTNILLLAPSQTTDFDGTAEVVKQHIRDFVERFR